jgi:D-3-phosphoglycerate dehydrogenase / 2-oxoglutarate reductase
LSVIGLICPNLADLFIEKFKADGIEARSLDISNLFEFASETEVLIVDHKTSVIREQLATMPMLKYICVAGGGTDNIDLKYTELHAIKVESVDSNVSSTAEFTVYLLLTMSRETYRIKDPRRPQSWSKKEVLGHDLFMKNLGIIGFGRVGQLVAKMCSSFTMNISVYDPLASESAFKNHGVQKATLKDVLNHSDFITIHTSLDSSTEGSIDKEYFDQMKDGAIIINTSRGKIINESDLVDALKSKKIGACALDVFEEEPLPMTSPLFGQENCYITPHIAGHNLDSRRRVVQQVTRKVTKFVK